MVTGMTDKQKILCHAYVTMVFQPLHSDKYKVDMWESYDEARIRVHNQLCEEFGFKKKVIEDLVERAGWMFGVDPHNDPYFDISSVSDKFIELIEEEIWKRQENDSGHE